MMFPYERDAKWADEENPVVNCHSRSATHWGAQEVWLLSMMGSKVPN